MDLVKSSLFVIVVAPWIPICPRLLKSSDILDFFSKTVVETFRGKVLFPLAAPKTEAIVRFAMKGLFHFEKIKTKNVSTLLEIFSQDLGCTISFLNEK